MLPDNELVPWVVMLDEGSDGINDIDVGGRSIQVVRIPISFPLITFEDHHYGLRLTLPVSFGFHDLSASTVQDGEIRESFSTFTLLPGLEWTLRMPERGIVKPFAEIGFSAELSSSQSVWLYSLGSRLLRPISKQNDDVRVGALLKLSGSSAEGAVETDTILTGELGIERMFTLAVSLRGEPVQLGIYALAHHNFTRVVIKELDRSMTDLQHTGLELGFSFGTENKTTLLGFGLPRIGLSYRSSGEFRSWRVNFGFPF
jgi:hypothetical protein